MKRLITVAALCAAVSGCATVDLSKLPDPEPLPKTWKRDLATDFRAMLKDPYSVRDASVSEPYKAAWNGKPTWGACVEYNAKNGFGAYTGKDAAFVYLVGDNWQTDPFQVASREWSQQNGFNPGLCGKPMQPFPELGNPS